MKTDCKKTERASPFPTRTGVKGKLNFVYKNWCEKLNFNFIKKGEEKNEKTKNIFDDDGSCVFGYALLFG